MAYPILAPSNTWYKSSALRSTITQINIVDTYTPTGNESETWNADVDNSGSIKCYLNGSILTIAGNGSGKIAMNEDSSYLFSDINQSDDDNIKMFLNCSNINGLNLLDSSSVTNMRQIFGYCIALTELDLSSWDVSNVTTLRYAFGSYTTAGMMSLTTLNLSGWNVTNKCTSFRNMFQNCENLTSLDVSNWDISSATDTNNMFLSCSSLTSLDVSKWNVGNVTNMQAMFDGCSSLTTLDISNWNVEKVSNMSHMFGRCTSLISLDVANWNVDNVTTTQEMFARCISLTSLDLSNWNTSKVTTFENMLYGMQKLEKITIGTKFGYNANGLVTATLPTPSATYIIDADGNWYTKDGNAHSTAIIPGSVATTYYASKRLTLEPVLAPNSTWYKSSEPRSTITQINIVDSYTPTGSEVESWNAGTDNSNSVKCYRDGTVLIIVGNSSGKIIMNADSSYAFSYQITATSQVDKTFINCVAINGVNLLDSSSATTFDRLFQYCASVTSLDLNSWNTSNVTNMQNTFSNCQALKTLVISNWDVKNVTTMRSMFQTSYSLLSLDLSSWDVSNVTSMSRMFVSSSDSPNMSLTTIGNVSNWNTSKVTDMEYMFGKCASLTFVDVSKWNVSNVTSMLQMFIGCESITSLDVSNWNVGKVTNMRSMFSGCMSLTSLDLSNWDVGNVTNMKWMFDACISLTSLDLSNWNTSKVTTFEYMFDNVQKLKKITLGSKFSYNGNGNASSVAVLPTPSSEHILDADGFWYTYDGVAYTPEEAVKNVPMTYYAVNPVFDRDYLTKGRTVLQLAKATREKFDITDKITVEQITNIIKDLVNAEEVAF